MNQWKEGEKEVHMLLINLKSLLGVKIYKCHSITVFTYSSMISLSVIPELSIKKTTVFSYSAK